MSKKILNVEGDEGQSIPLIIDSPHSGTEYPLDFNHQADFAQLRQAEDSYVDELYKHVSSIGGVFLDAKFPRSYIDPNRSENDFILEDLHEKNNSACEIKFKPTIKSQLGIGLVWLKIPPNGEPMYRDKITLKQLMHRVNTYHRPYHKILKNILDNTYKKFGNFYHVNAHSMQNQATAMSDQSQGTKRPDFVIGDREGTSCKRRFTDLIVDFLKSLNYSVDVNYPYKGMELVRAYSDPLQNKNSVQIEVNRKLYMNEETREKIDNFKILKQDLKKLINEIKKQYDEGYL
jgi:N-formylglutamate amidohydrolase